MKYLRFSRRQKIWVLSSALLIALLYYLIPSLARFILSTDSIATYAARDAENIVRVVRRALTYPFVNGKWLVLPYWILVFAILSIFIKMIGKAWKWIGIVAFLSYTTLYAFPDLLIVFENDRPSQTHGTVSNGHIEDAKRFPFRGDNHTTYSFLCYLLGRTYSHDKVRDAVLDSYAACAKNLPEVKFVMGEIGSKCGGKFLPHRTHRSGMSIDFMTPLKNEAGENIRPFYFWNLWGFGLDYDASGKGSGNIEIDFEATAIHLKALEESAEKHGLRIQKVIFHPDLRNKLLASPSGQHIRHLPYTRNPVVIRHDDHYHVDFALR